MKFKFIYRAWRYRRRVESGEIQYLRSRLQAGDWAIDIGAHKGAFTYWMRKAVGPTGLVTVFEPQPELADYLRRVVTRFHWQNVHVHGLALSDAEGVRPLYRPEDGPALGATLSRCAHVGGDSIPVRVTSLDRCLDSERQRSRRRVRLIKCDVEGHELPVFRGARRILIEDAPLVMFDCESRHHFTDTVQDVFSYLRDLGFNGRYFCSGQEREIDEFDAERDQRPEDGRYAYSFLFERPQAA